MAEGRRRGFFEIALETSTRLGLLAGGAFALIQFLDAQQEARIERTTSYITRYEDGRPAQARRNINRALRPYLEQFKALQGEAYTEADRSDMVLSLVEANDGALADDIDTIVEFYEGLSTCVSEGLCDKRVAERYFNTGVAREFYDNFRPYLMLRRQNNPGYASGLLKLMAAPEASSAPPAKS